MLTSSYEFPTKGEGPGFPNPVDGWGRVQFRTNYSLLQSLLAHSVQCGSLQLTVAAVTSMGKSPETEVRNSAWAKKQAQGNGEQAWLASQRL